MSPLSTKEIFTWGSLAYGFIPKDHRVNKLSNRSFGRRVLMDSNFAHVG